MSWLRRVAESRVARPILLVAGALLVWDLLVRLLDIPPYLVPPPGKVVRQLVAQWPQLWRESLVTTYAAVGGFLLGILVGIPLAVAIAASPLVASLLFPILVFSQSVPKIAVAPLFVVWWGFGILPKLVTALLLGFFPIVVSTVTGLRSVEPELVDLARSMRASPLQSFVKIRFPHALPSVFAGLKVSVTLALVGAVVGEFVGSNSGIGYVLQIANGNFDLPTMFAALVLLSMIGVLLFAAVDLVERLAIPWHVSRRVDVTGAA